MIDEVDGVLASLNGQSIPYEKLNQMKYLDMVLSEALRKWPAFRVTPRYCEKDYVLKSDDGETYKIKSGTDVMIPIGAIQRDSKYYPCPEKFDPERFSEENKGKIPSGAFLPFGLVSDMKIAGIVIIIDFIPGTTRLPRKPLCTFGGQIAAVLHHLEV